MLTKNALYDFVEDAIGAAGAGDALYGALAFRNLRSSVDENVKVVRVECFTGDLEPMAADAESELNVRATIQCWVLPDFAGFADEQAAVDDATDDSFQMARELARANAQTMNLGGRVCVAEFREFETGEARLAAVRRGVTYLDGLINRAEEG